MLGDSLGAPTMYLNLETNLEGFIFAFWILLYPFLPFSDLEFISSSNSRHLTPFPAPATDVLTTKDTAVYQQAESCSLRA